MASNGASRRERRRRGRARVRLRCGRGRRAGQASRARDRPRGVRPSGRLAGVWAEARPGAAEPLAWDRHAAWAQERDGAVDLMLVTRAGTATRSTAASPFSAVVVETFDPDAVGDAPVAMEHLREDAAEREARAHERHLEVVAAARPRAPATFATTQTPR